MLKNITKIFVAGIAIIALQPVYSMEIYTVKPGDYLFKIAKANAVGGVSIGPPWGGGGGGGGGGSLEVVSRNLPKILVCGEVR